MKFFAFSVTILVWVGMAFWLHGQAATTANVTATVTAQTFSVAVSDGSISYGTLATSATQDTAALSDAQTVENDGNVAATMNVLGATTEAWTLVAAAGTDEFRHRYASDGGSTWVALTDSYQLFVPSLASDATHALDLEIQVPTSTTATSTQNTTVTVQATSP